MKIFRAVKTNYITQKFGVNKLYYQNLLNDSTCLGHNGWDWRAYDNEPLYFDCDCRGTIIETHIDKCGGLGIKIITNDKDGNFKHLYWHLKSFACKPGDIVESGDLIGYNDNTGRSIGSHLHRSLKPVVKNNFGNWVNKFPNNGFYGGIDPEPYYKNIFVLDYIATLKKQIPLLQQIIRILKKIIELQIEINLKVGKISKIS